MPHPIERSKYYQAYMRQLTNELEEAELRRLRREAKAKTTSHSLASRLRLLFSKANSAIVLKRAEANKRHSALARIVQAE